MSMTRHTLNYLYYREQNRKARMRRTARTLIAVALMIAATLIATILIARAQSPELEFPDQMHAVNVCMMDTNTKEEYLECMQDEGFGFCEECDPLLNTGDKCDINDENDPIRATCWRKNSS